MIHFLKKPSDKHLPMSVSEYLKKTFVYQKSRAHQAGQAVVEYMLVLIITVAIILGTMSQFSDAFKQFLDSYFGDYIACLLETGELPSFGGEGITSGECNAKFETFSIANGRPRTQSSGSGGSGNSSSSGAGQSGSGGGGDSTNSAGKRNLRSRSFTSGGGSSNAEASSLAANLKPASINGRQNNQSNSGGGDSGGADSSDGGFGGNRKSRKYRTRVITLGDEYLTEDAKRKSSKVVSKSKKSKKEKARESLRAARFELKVPEKRAVASDEDSTGFSVGAIIKFLLIAGIIVAIFLFLGGQAMQIKKSWQKSE